MGGDLLALELYMHLRKARRQKLNGIFYCSSAGLLCLIMNMDLAHLV